MNTRFSLAQTQDGQLVDHERMFAEFDKKCIRLELLTAPLNQYSNVSAPLRGNVLYLNKRKRQ